MFILTSTPNHTPLKYNCLNKKNDHEKQAYFSLIDFYFKPIVTFISHAHKNKEVSITYKYNLSTIVHYSQD